MNLFELAAKITLDTNDYEKGIDKAKDSTSSFASKIGSGLKTAAKVGAAAIGTVVTATTSMTTALVKGVSQTAEYGDNIDKMSQKLGMTAEAYQEWDAVMQHCGTSIESMQAGMKTLASAAETGNAAFEKLGISQDEMASMSQEELFGATITALQNVENETERTYLAGQLLGRGATELGALLNTSAEETQAMKDRVHELGGVLSNESVKAAAAFQDSLQDMKTAFSGLSKNLTAIFLPSITTVMDGLTEIFSGNSSTGIGLIKKGVEDFTTKLTDAVPKVLEVGVSIVNGLISSISNNLPKLMTSGVDVIMSLALGISDAIPQLAESAVAIIDKIVSSLAKNFPEIVSAALETILALSRGIAKSLPELIPAIVQIVAQIVTTLTDPATLGSLIEVALQMIMAIAQGLMDALPQLAHAVPEIIGAIVATIITELPNILAAGVEILLAIITGLMEALPELSAAIPDIIIAIVNGVVANLDKIIVGGVNLLLALAKGIISAIPQLVAYLPRVIQSIVTTFRDYNWSGIGSNIVAGIKQGVANAWKNFKQWFKNLFGDLVGIAKKILGIASPSKVFKQIGKFTTEGLAIGLESGAEDAYSAMSNISRGVISSYSGNMSTITQNAQSGGGLSGVSVSLNIGTFYNNTDDDLNALADKLSELIAEKANRKVAAYA